MKYLPFFLMIALIPFLAQPMDFQKSAALIGLENTNKNTFKKIKKSTKTRATHVSLDSQGIEGIYPSPRTKKKIVLITTSTKISNV